MTSGPDSSHTLVLGLTHCQKLVLPCALCPLQAHDAQLARSSRRAQLQLGVRPFAELLTQAPATQQASAQAPASTGEGNPSVWPFLREAQRSASSPAYPHGAASEQAVIGHDEVVRRSQSALAGQYGAASSPAHQEGCSHQAAIGQRPKQGMKEEGTDAGAGQTVTSCLFAPCFL